MVDTRNIEFDALRNAIYHTSRAGYYDRWDRVLSLLVVAGGTAAIVDIAKAYVGYPELFAALAAFSGVLQLVFDFRGKVRTHEYLQRRFYELLAEIKESHEATPKHLARWGANLRRLYAEEPEPMRALDSIAYNAALDSMGGDEKKRIPLAFYHSLFRHILPFNGTKF